MDFSALKDWQPLIAAFVALGGASLVYRGARLAYLAAMAKVDLDREMQAREVRRRKRGIYLRVSIVIPVLFRDCEQFLVWLKTIENMQSDQVVNVDTTRFTFTKISEDGLEEAWNNLDAFPRVIAVQIRKLKIGVINVEVALRAIERQPKFKRDELPAPVINIRKFLMSLKDDCNETGRLLNAQIDELDQEEPSAAAKNS